jgi:hypothetical protein
MAVLEAPTRFPQRGGTAVVIWGGAGVLAAGLGLVATVSPALGVVGGVAVLVATVLLRWPEVAVPLAVALVYSNGAVVVAGELGLPSTVAALVPMLLAVPLVARIHRGEAVAFPLVTMLLLLYLVVQIAASTGALDVHVAAEGVIGYVSEGLVLICLIVNVVRTPTQVRRAVWTVLLVGALLAVGSMLQWTTGDFENSLGGFATTSDNHLEKYSDDITGTRNPPRAGGPNLGPNRYAQVLVVLVPMGVMLARTSPTRRLRLGAWACTALVVGGIVLTYSRGAALVVALVGLLLFALGGVRLRHLVLTITVLLVLSSAFPRWTDRFDGATAVLDPDQGVEQADGSTRGRVSSTLGAFRVFADHPLLGVGPGNYPLHHRDAAEQVGIRIADTRQPHNLPGQIAAETGTVGLLVFFGIVALAMRSAVRGRRSEEGSETDRGVATGLLIAMVAYLGSATFLHLAYERYFWLLVALAVAAGLTAGERTPMLAMPKRRRR